MITALQYLHKNDCIVSCFLFCRKIIALFDGSSISPFLIFSFAIGVKHGYPKLSVFILIQNTRNEFCPRLGQQSG